VVDELGMGVSGWKVGDKVITAMQQAPEVNGAPQGSYAEYVIARASDIARKSSKMTFEQAAGVPTVALTAWRELVVRAHVHAGQKVLIQGGAGGVGSAAVQIAKALGATVIATASPNNDDYLKSIGASQVIDYNSTKFEDVVHDADIVLDTVGGDTAARSPATLRPGGIYLSVASRDNPPECTQGKISCPPPAPRSADTVGPWLTEVGKLIDAGQYQTNVFKVFPLQQAAAAQALNAEHHTRGKIVLSVRAGSERR
jgi:NADPH:quinone reductase-like Zn-dependent oxidoreductase